MVFSQAVRAVRRRGPRARRRVCGACDGRQVEMRTEPLTLDLPAGLADGARIRVPAKGHAGRDGGRERGSLRDRARRSRIRCSGARATTCMLVVPVAIHEAALGAQHRRADARGPARLRVPPGTQSGQRFRLRERGAPSAQRPAGRSGRRGAAGAAEAARRAIEGAAAGVRPDQRRGRPEENWRSGR